MNNSIDTTAEANQTKPAWVVPNNSVSKAESVMGTPICDCNLEIVFWGGDTGYMEYRCCEALGKGKYTSIVHCTASPYSYVLKLPIAEDPRRHPPAPRGLGNGTCCMGCGATSRG